MLTVYYVVHLKMEAMCATQSWQANIVYQALSMVTDTPRQIAGAFSCVRALRLLHCDDKSIVGDVDVVGQPGAELSVGDIV